MPGKPFDDTFLLVAVVGGAGGELVVETGVGDGGAELDVVLLADGDVAVGWALLEVVTVTVGEAVELGCVDSLWWVTVRNGIKVRTVVGAVVTGSRPGTVTWALRDVGPTVVARGAVRVGDGADWLTALPQAASSRAAMPWPATISAVRRLEWEATPPH